MKKRKIYLIATQTYNGYRWRSVVANSIIADYLPKVVLINCGDPTNPKLKEITTNTRCIYFFNVASLKIFGWQLERILKSEDIVADMIFNVNVPCTEAQMMKSIDNLQICGLNIKFEFINVVI